MRMLRLVSVLLFNSIPILSKKAKEIAKQYHIQTYTSLCRTMLIMFNMMKSTDAYMILITGFICF